MIYLVVADGEVVNVIVWDGVANWSPPQGAKAEVAPPKIGIGSRRVGGQWRRPVFEEIRARGEPDV